jgi:ABC-type Fe3+ transport system substrate-binding protein
MMIRALIGALMLLAPLAAHAQDINELAAKAKGQKLQVFTAGEDAWGLMLGVFGKKFDIDVDQNVARPSVALSRIRTEQKSGQFVWDLWMGGTSNMVNAAVPAGLLEPLEQYFVLPEVKDMSNWRHPDYIFNDAGRHVFAHVNRLDFFAYRNTANIPDVKVETWEDLLNPKLKGKISIRDMSVPNAGTFTLATMYKDLGADALRKFLKEQDVHIYENVQQLENAVVRGDQVLSIGLEPYSWDKCRADGGCKTIEQVRPFGAVISNGMTIPKNPPHADVVRLWVNWFLSKEGQTEWVKAWAKDNTTGAISMRKDVPPAPGHEPYLPDFSKADHYLFVSSEKGSTEIEETIKIYKEATGRL